MLRQSKEKYPELIDKTRNLKVKKNNQEEKDKKEVIKIEEDAPNPAI